MIALLAGFTLIGVGILVSALAILLPPRRIRAARRAAADAETREWAEFITTPAAKQQPPVTADGTPEPMARIARRRRAEMGLPPLPGLQPVLEHTLPLGATADWLPQLHARAATGFYHDAAPGAAQARAAAAAAQAAGIHPAAAAEAAFAALQGQPLEQSLAETRWGVTGHAIRDRLTQATP